MEEGMEDGAEIRPFLKWAGGKRWLVDRHVDLFPSEFGRYYEPFLGGASVFFKLQPERATLSDLNSELISTYDSIREDPSAVKAALQRLGDKHSLDHYYRVRDMIPANKVEVAARFLYLNRTCWNGLYRVNKLGKFNVPIGTKTNVILPTDDFEAVSRLLQGVTLRVCDFASTISRSRAGDFVYCDPPYTVQHDNNGFLKYNEAIFTWRDQVRLFESLVRASERGVLFAVSNARHSSILQLYKGFKIRELQRASVISGVNKGRGGYAEVLVSNY